MWKNLIYILIFLNIIIQILSDDISYILSNTGNKGVGITSFNKNLYLLSSSYIYNIINENYLPIKNNININPSEKQFYKNFEMIEASINIYTNESVFLIAEYHASNNKINLYSFNITSSRNAQNPKLIYSKNSVFGNARISLINVGIDKYLLSYIINENTFESIWFEYTYYEGFEILRNFPINVATNHAISTGMSCFLLYDQFPICFYSTKNILTSQFNLNIIVFDTVFVRYYLYHIELYNILPFTNTYNDISFTKAIYLYKDHAVFCYMEQQTLYCDINYLKLDFETLTLTKSGGITTTTTNGGSPSSTAGGIRVTTLAVLFTALWSQIRGKTTISIFKRSIPDKTVKNAFVVFFISICLLLISTVIIFYTHDIETNNFISDLSIVNHQFIGVFYEVTSAFGTVGLSIGVTAICGPLALIVLIIVMFIGQLSVSSFLLLFTNPKNITQRATNSYEDIRIG